MRCVYHGWKFDVDGQLRGYAERARGVQLREKVRTPPTRAGARRRDLGLHGPGRPPPPLPELECTLLPEGHIFASRRVQDCNWLQAMEGGIDSSHISFLHAPDRPSEPRGSRRTWTA